MADFAPPQASTVERTRATRLARAELGNRRWQGAILRWTGGGRCDALRFSPLHLKLSVPGGFRYKKSCRNFPTRRAAAAANWSRAFWKWPTVRRPWRKLSASACFPLPWTRAKARRPPHGKRAGKEFDLRSFLPPTLRALFRAAAQAEVPGAGHVHAAACQPAPGRHAAVRRRSTA